MSDPVYSSTDISIYEWPQPCCEVGCRKEDGSVDYVQIRSAEDARAVIDSLTRFLDSLES